jgi:hypothetical protein
MYKYTLEIIHDRQVPIILTLHYCSTCQLKIMQKREREREGVKKIIAFFDVVCRTLIIIQSHNRVPLTFTRLESHLFDMSAN